MRRISHAVASLLALVLTLGATASCSPDEEAKPTTVRIGATATPDSMDPTTNSALAISEALLYNVYETLVKLDPNGSLRPLLAEEWSVTADQLTYSFKLRSGAKFFSGAPVDAAAVAASIKRIQTNERITPVNRGLMSVVAETQVVDPATLKVTLTTPSNSWIYNMAGSMGAIIDPTVTEESLATTPAGSGPYQLSQWRKGEAVILTRNPSYWGTAGNFETVTFKYYADPNAMTTAMLSGDLDIISNLAAPQSLQQFSDTSKYTTIIGNTNGEIVMGFNHQNAALSDLRVRQAICYGLNREALRDAVWAGYGTLIGSMVPPEDPWYEDLSGLYPFNPAKARELLAEAGYSAGLTLRLRVPTLPYATGSAQFIVSQMADIGVTIVVDELEFPARWVDEVMVNSNYDITIVSHSEPRDIGKWADPSYYWHYDNKEVQRLIAEAEVSETGTQIADMKAAARLLAEDAAADWLWLLPSIKVARVGFQGVSVNSIGWSFDVTAISYA